MLSQSSIERIKFKVLPVLEKYRVKKAAFFGSIVAGKFNKASDVDILVELTDELSLFDFMGLKNELEDTVGRKVDLVEYGTIKTSLKEKILGQQVAIL